MSDKSKKRIGDYSIKELRCICQATAPDPSTESYVGRFCRIFSIYATKMFLYTNVTPNQITILSVIVFFSGIAMFFVNTYDYNIFAAILVWLSIVLDGADGEVSRFRNDIEKKTDGSKVGGVYTEPVSHDIQYGFSFLIMGVAFCLNTGIVVYLVLGGLAGIFKLEYRLLKMRFLITTDYINNVVNKSIKEENYKRRKNLLANLFSYVNRNFLSSTGFLLSIFIFAVFDKIEWSLWFYGISYGLFWLVVFARQIFVIIKNKY
jgi:hypothetical protein